ncbi:MAG: hypothetical protein HS116_24860 [Planctomycetes bacterium]|nr:hypothetical protein [Planctomycetota bacterium]
MQSFCGILYANKNSAESAESAVNTVSRMDDAGAEAVCIAAWPSAWSAISDALINAGHWSSRIYWRDFTQPCSFWRAVSECEWFAGGRACLIARADEEFDVDLWPLANRFADNDWKGCVVALAPHEKADVRVARKADLSRSSSPTRWIERFSSMPTANAKFVSGDHLLTGVGIYDGQLWDVLGRMNSVQLQDDLSVPHAYLHDRSLDFLEINAGYKRV